MANSGKFIDRTPFIHTAGVSQPRTVRVKDCMTVHSCDDAIETVLHEAGLHPVPFEQKLQKMDNTRHRGTFTEVRKLLNPPVETRYQTLIRDLRETNWQSYWLRDLGSIRDPIGGLPKQVDENTAFGLTVKSNGTAKDCVNPSTSHYENLFHESEYHDLYRKTHNNYYPGEKINYDYKAPFDAKKCFGTPTKSSVSAECCMRPLNVESVTVANEILSDFHQNSKPQLGKPLTPNKNIKCVPEGHRFGMKTVRVFHSVGELIKPDIEASQLKKDFIIYLSALNETRRSMKKKALDWNMLKAQCMYFDKTQCGWIQLQQFDNVMSFNNLHYVHEDILPLAEVFGFFKDDHVSYKNFLDMFNVHCVLPDFGKFIEPGFNPSCYYMTMNQYNQFKAMNDKNICKPRAGLKSYREDVERPLKPEGGIKADISELGSETTSGALLNPSIMTTYNLSHIDLLLPRKPEFMRTLYDRLGYEFPEDTFEQMWQIGVRLDKNRENMVCADTFKRIMNEATPFEVKEIPETYCDYENLVREQGI